jgi:hypothetical protein
MKKIITNNAILFTMAAILTATAILSSPTITNAYSYAGYKWNSYPVSVDASDASFPASWTSPLAYAMSAWNGASSPFYFNVGYSGHQVKCANSGNNGKVAVTTISRSGSQITDCDITFNTYYPWSTSGGAGAYDVQNVTTHELGHWLTLLDLYGGGDTEKTMYGYVSTGETKKRTLETDDLNGINYIYP